MKFGGSFGIFLNSAHLICRSTDISKCFNGSLRLRDNESRLYMNECADGGVYTWLVVGNTESGTQVHNFYLSLL